MAGGRGRVGRLVVGEVLDPYRERSYGARRAGPHQSDDRRGVNAAREEGADWDVGLEPHRDGMPEEVIELVGNLDGTITEGTRRPRCSDLEGCPVRLGRRETP